MGLNRLVTAEEAGRKGEKNKNNIKNVTRSPSELLCV